jgi:hypothetical protein
MSHICSLSPWLRIRIIRSDDSRGSRRD